MSLSSRVGRLIGLMLLVQLPTGLIVPYVLLKPLTAPPAGFLATAAGLDTLVRTCVLLLFVGGALAVAISAAAWPAVRERAPRAGLWMLALAAANFTLQAIENAHWLTMISVSQAALESGATGLETYRPIGVAVRAAWKWAHYSHILVVVGWFGALYLALFRAALLPRLLPLAGLATCGLHFIGITLPVFAGYRMPQPALFGMPLAVATLAAAFWLMARGFPAPHPAAGVRARGVEEGPVHA